MGKTQLDLSPEIKELGIEEYARELESNGLTIVPPEVNEFGLERIDRIVEIILERAEAMTGAKFTLAEGPLDELEFPKPKLTPEQMKQIEALGFKEAVLNPTQFLIQKLTQVDRLFRDLAVNPVSVALQNHMMAGQTRLSSANCFVKWQGDFGYGPGLGLHADQAATPLPWGPVAHSGNSTWCLTDYTLDGGALAYVPGTHTEGKPTPPPDRIKDAIPAEAPKGSVIVWHGATWHGAFPRKDKGLRLGLAVYHRHAANLPQEDVPGQTTEAMVADTDNPEVYRVLAGLTDKFPYRETQSEVVPHVKTSAAAG